jgi:hypothetical protein
MRIALILSASGGFYAAKGDLTRNIGGLSRALQSSQAVGQNKKTTSRTIIYKNLAL